MRQHSFDLKSYQRRILRYIFGVEQTGGYNTNIYIDSKYRKSPLLFSLFLL